MVQFERIFKYQSLCKSLIPLSLIRLPIQILCSILHNPWIHLQKARTQLFFLLVLTVFRPCASRYLANNGSAHVHYWWARSIWVQTRAHIHSEVNCRNNEYCNKGLVSSTRILHFYTWSWVHCTSMLSTSCGIFQYLVN